jgi:predicted enzyme related to lactoylglutathione lyase
MPMSEMTYTIIKVGEGTGGGLMKNPIPGASSAWVPYVLVDNVRAATDKAKALGATLMKDVSEVPGMGSFSIVTDPTGAMLGLWETRKA